MNPQDTPLARFKTFWWALAIFAVFGVAAFLFHSFATVSDDAVVTQSDERRTEYRTSTESEQAKVFAEGPSPAEAYSVTGKKILARPVSQSIPVAAAAAPAPAADAEAAPEAETPAAN